MASLRFDKVWHQHPTIGANDITGTTSTMTMGASAYTYGVGGNAAFIFFKNPYADELDKIKVFITATTTAGNILLEIREYDAATGKPKSGAAAASQTIANPGSLTNKWLEVALSSPPTLALNKCYYIIFGNAGGNYTFRTDVRSHAGNQTSFLNYGTTANGFGTATTGGQVVNGLLPLVLTYDDGHIEGAGPYTVRVTSTFSAATPQGLYISGVTEDFVIKGVEFFADTPANITHLSIYRGASPAFGVDAPVHTETFMLRNCEELNIIWFENDFLIEAGETYWIMLGSDAATFALHAYRIEDRASFATELGAASFAGGEWKFAYVSAGSFTTDDTYFPFLSLIHPYVGAGNDDVPPGGHCDCGVEALVVQVNPSGEVDLLESSASDTNVAIHVKWQAATGGHPEGDDVTKSLLRPNVNDNEGRPLHETSVALRKVNNLLTELAGDPPFDTGPISLTPENGYTGTLTIRKVGLEVELDGHIDASAKTDDTFVTLDEDFRPVRVFEELQPSL